MGVAGAASMLFIILVSVRAVRLRAVYQVVSWFQVYLRFVMTVSPASNISFPESCHSTARLLADIGGTNARFALELGPGRITAIKVLPCADYRTLFDALTDYLSSPAVRAVVGVSIRHAAIAIANPVVDDFVRMTNHHWEFSIKELRCNCGFETLDVVNDFYALAMSLPHLSEHDKRQVGGGSPCAGAPIGLVGAGTGLGVSGLVAGRNGWTALRSEGGHVTFSPGSEVEVAILQYAWREFDHVSAERFLSGAGLELIYRALAYLKHRRPEGLSAAEISRRALCGECDMCAEAIDVFCGMLGTVAGNLAITLGAQGGVYIGGGIVPRLGDHFEQSAFRRRFEQKGRFVNYLSGVPTYVITTQYPAFVGVSAILAERLGS